MRMASPVPRISATEKCPLPLRLPAKPEPIGPAPFVAEQRVAIEDGSSADGAQQPTGCCGKRRRTHRDEMPSKYRRVAETPCDAPPLHGGEELLRLFPSRQSLYKDLSIKDDHGVYWTMYDANVVLSLRHVRPPGAVLKKPVGAPTVKRRRKSASTKATAHPPPAKEKTLLMPQCG